MIGYRKASRRAFLAGAGATVALPFLESALPRSARAQAAPQRFIGYYVPCGIHMAEWTPGDQGAGYELRRILEPLASVQQHVSVLTGLANRPARPDGAGDHASGTGAFLTCAHPYKTGGSDIRNGISLDQRLAGELGGDTALRSVQMGIDGGSSAGDCDSGYSCAYARNISWAGPASPLPKLTDPNTIFDRLFAGVDPTATQAQQEARRRRGLSLLDFVRGDATKLSGQLGVADQHKLDEYLTSLRELEMRIAGNGSENTCDPGARPGADLTYAERATVQADLMVLALKCDVTRFMTFMLGNAGSGRSYEFLGVTGGHHELSHHGGNPDNLESLTRIGRWEMEQFAYLVGRLAEADEGGQSLLDSTLLFLSSEIEDGDTHSHFNMPILLAGKGGNVVANGEHRVFGSQPSVGQLFVSILQGFGLPDSRFGDDGEGPLSGLL